MLYGRPAPEMTPECLVVSLSDAIAYINHDIDDAIRAGIITNKILPESASAILGTTNSSRINAMVVGVIEGSANGKINIIPEIREAMRTLRDFLYRDVYPSEPIESEIRKTRQIVRELYAQLLENPDLEMFREMSDDSPERRVVDYIAGMTDEFAMRLHESLKTGMSNRNYTPGRYLRGTGPSI